MERADAAPKQKKAGMLMCVVYSGQYSFSFSYDKITYSYDNNTHKIFMTIFINNIYNMKINIESLSDGVNVV